MRRRTFLAGASMILPGLNAGMLLGSQAGGGVPTYSMEGVWSWFSDPRALSVGGDAAIGCVLDDGSIVVYPSPGAAAVTFKAAYAVDDHNVPAFLVRASDSKVLAAYTGHVVADFFTRISTNANDASAWGAETNIDSQLGLDKYTYANLLQLTGEVDDPIYLFFRAQPSGGGTDRAFHYSKSTDGGTTWGTPTRLLTGTHYYIRVIASGGNRIDVCITKHPDGFQSVGDFGASLYHIYYQGGTWQQIGGAALTLPINPLTDLTPIWQGNIGAGPAWIWDIAMTGGNPVITYAVFPHFNNHRIRYARHNGTSWVDNEIVPSGRLITENDLQRYYSGGAALDHANPDIVYISQKFGATWNILRGVTANNGASFSLTKVAEQVGGKAFRPVIVRDHATEPRLAYLDGTYTDGAVYNTDVKLISSAAGTNAAPSAVTLSTTTVYDNIGSGASFATLGATDTDFHDQHAFSIVADPDAKFQISGDKLQLAAAVSAPATHDVTIRATDSGGNTVDTPFTITVASGAFRAATIQKPLRPSTGTQDFTLAGFGTPVAARVTLTPALEAGVARDTLAGSEGVTDGTSQAVMSWASRHNVSPANTYRRGATDEVGMVLDPSSGNPTVEVNFDSWITDGVRLNVGLDSANTPYLITVELYGGSGASAKVGTVTLATQNNVVTVAPGFQTKALMVLGQAGAFNDASSTTAIASTGFASYDGVTIRQCAFVYRADNGNPTATQGEVRSGGVMALPVGRYAQLENITATQFDLRSIGGNLSTWTVAYLALGGCSAWAGIMDSPTTTTGYPYNHDLTDVSVGFTPAYAALIPNMVTTIDSQRTDGTASGWALSAVTGLGEVTSAWADEDNQATSDTQVLADEQAVNLYDHAGTQAFDAARDSLISNGLRIAVSKADATARKWPVLFLAS